MTDEVDEMSAGSRGYAVNDLYGGGFNKWLESIGKSRETATDADEIQWLKLDRQRLAQNWRWIPVTERLPSIGERVAALTSGGRRIVACRTTLYSRHCWIEYGDEVDVTHWMNLPSPPTYDKNGCIEQPEKGR